MQYRKIGSSDLVVSEIALGSWLTYSGYLRWQVESDCGLGSIGRNRYSAMLHAARHGNCLRAQSCAAAKCGGF